MKRNCPICNVLYEADPKRIKHGRQTTCSRKCSYRYRALQLEKKVQLRCLCGNVFYRISSKANAEQSFCNIECRGRFLKSNLGKRWATLRSWEYTCFYCNEKFSTSVKRNKNRIFCDRECYEKQKSKDMAGSKNHMYGRAPHFKPIMWKQGRHVVGRQCCYFRSSWELAVAHYLESQDLTWEYEYQRYQLKSLDKTYVPDFFVLNGGSIEKIIEVKGWMKQKDRDKIAAFRLEYTIPLEVWQRKKLRSLNLLDCNGYGVCNE